MHTTFKIIPIFVTFLLVQHSIFAEEDYCIYNYNYEEMDEVVLDVIEHNIQLGKIKRI